jgi:fermentation-respiration switch protein FrsA (DUF1100 family)
VGSFLLYLITIVVLAYVAWGLVLLLMQPKLLYRPVREVLLTPRGLGLDFEEVAFQSDDAVTLSGWYVPARNAPCTVLFCHGNGGNIMHRLDSVNLFHDLGVNCFLFDYRGYARAAYDWLVRDKAVPAEQIILFGRSLGGSIAARLAGRVRVRALVVESAFTSYPDIGAKFYPYLPVRPFARFSYNTQAYLREVRCPVMVVHSRDDELVSFEFGTRLFAAANEPKQFVEVFGSHNDGFLVSGDLYKEAWIKWLGFVKDYEPQSPIHTAS